MAQEVNVGWPLRKSKEGGSGGTAEVLEVHKELHKLLPSAFSARSLKEYRRPCFKLLTVAVVAVPE